MTQVVTELDQSRRIFRHWLHPQWSFREVSRYTRQCSYLIASSGCCDDNVALRTLHHGSETVFVLSHSVAAIPAIVNLSSTIHYFALAFPRENPVATCISCPKCADSWGALLC